MWPKKLFFSIESEYDWANKLIGSSKVKLETKNSVLLAFIKFRSKFFWSAIVWG
jgi:hypothetical protein